MSGGDGLDLSAQVELTSGTMALETSPSRYPIIDAIFEDPEEPLLVDTSRLENADECDSLIDVVRSAPRVEQLPLISSTVGVSVIQISEEPTNVYSSTVPDRGTGLG